MNNDGILGLLKIMDLAKQWPQFQAIHDMAQMQLVEANGQAAVELKNIAERKAKAEAEAKAKVVAEAAAKAKAEEDKAQRDAQQAEVQAARDARAAQAEESSHADPIVRRDS